MMAPHASDALMLRDSISALVIVLRWIAHESILSHFEASRRQDRHR
jgi:hypothetical protein